MKRPAVVDSDHDTAAVCQVSHARITGDGQRWMSGGHSVHVVDLATRGLLPVEPAAVPAGKSGLLKWLHLCERLVRPPEYRVRTVRRGDQRFAPRLSIWNVGEIGRRLLSRPIVLVIA